MTSQSVSRNFSSNTVEGTTFIKACDEKKLPASYAVFQKIKEIISNTPLWENILLRVNAEVIKSTESLDDLMTSCTINAYLVNMFFVGEAQTKRIYDFLNLNISAQAKILSATINYVHLLSGNALLDLASKFQDTSFDPSEKNIASCRKDFNEYDEQLGTFHENFLQMLRTSQTKPFLYDFNNNVINALESEIDANKNKVSKDCSFIYHVNITEPPPSITSTGSVESILKAPLGSFHAFVLEHFYNPEENTDCLRLHQSWKGISSLPQHYENHDTEGIVDGKKFCENLKGLHSWDNSYGFEKLKIYQSACFNINEDVALACVFRPDILLVTGRSVRYLTSQINPQDCLNHLDDIVTKYGS